MDIDELWEDFRRNYENLIIGAREEELQIQVEELQIEVTRLNAVIEAYKEVIKSKIN